MKISIMRWHHNNIEERLWIMKELEIVIKPEKLENLKRILDSDCLLYTSPSPRD